MTIFCVTVDRAQGTRGERSGLPNPLDEPGGGRVDRAVEPNLRRRPPGSVGSYPAGRSDHATVRDEDPRPGRRLTAGAPGSVEQRPVFGERRHPPVSVQCIHQLGLEVVLERDAREFPRTSRSRASPATPQTRRARRRRRAAGRRRPGSGDPPVRGRAPSRDRARPELAAAASSGRAESTARTA